MCRYEADQAQALADMGAQHASALAALRAALAEADKAAQVWSPPVGRENKSRNEGKERGNLGERKGRGGVPLVGSAGHVPTVLTLIGLCHDDVHLQEARASAQENAKRAEAAAHEAQAVREQCAAVEASAAERTDRWADTYILIAPQI